MAAERAQHSPDSTGSKDEFDLDELEPPSHEQLEPMGFQEQPGPARSRDTVGLVLSVVRVRA